MKNFTKLLLITILVCAMLLCGCSKLPENPVVATPKTFTKDGMSITLTDSFSESTQEGFTAVYKSTNTVFKSSLDSINCITVKKESFDSFSNLNITADSTLIDYAQAVMEANHLGCLEVKTAYDGQITYFTFEEYPDSILHVATVFKSADAFWLIQFSSPLITVASDYCYENIAVSQSLSSAATVTIE